MIENRKNGFDDSLELIFPLLRIIEKLSNTNEFIHWLNEYHNEKNSNPYFDGFKFIILVSIRRILSKISIYDYPFLSLKANRMFDRAMYLDRKINEIPNTCTKIIFLKNIMKLMNDLEKSRNFKTLEKGLEKFDYLFGVFKDFYEKNLNYNISSSKEELLSFLIKYRLLTEFTDGRFNGPPINNMSGSFKIDINEKYLERIGKGYAYTIQFLWFTFIDFGIFNQTSLQNLHKPFVITPSKDYFQKKEELYIEIDIQFWYDIDKHYNTIKERIIEPLFEIYNDINPFSMKAFEIVGNIQSNDLADYLKQVPEPEYITSNDIESQIKKLESNLFWYPCEVLGLYKGYSYSGVPVFVSTLAGLVKIRQFSNIFEPIYIKIFLHLNERRRENQHDISFGILIESAGLFDYSGWIIFYRCATDYSLTGEVQYELAKSIIQKMQDNYIIDLEKIIVSDNLFHDFVLNRAESVKTALDLYGNGTNEINELELFELQKKLNSLEKKIPEYKSQLFELIVYKYINSKIKYDFIQCNYTINNEEIDVYARKDNVIEIYECKINLHYNDLEKIIKQMLRKENIIKEVNQLCEIQKYLIIYNKVSTTFKRNFEKLDINIVDDFRSFLDRRIFIGSKTKLRKLLD